MKLLTKENKAQLPPLYAQENKGGEAIAHVKFFDPTSNWTWFCTEYDPDQQTFFGLVVGHEKEFGYFTLKELSEIKGRFGLGIERDRHFEPKTLGEIAPEMFTHS